MKKPLGLSLLILRISIFIVLLLWAIDKFFNPQAEAGLFERMYHLPMLSVFAMYAIGAFQILLATCFVIGLKKAVTYALVFIGNAIYVIAAYPFYMPPFHGDHLLFFPAWPMLAVCLTLYLLRKQDNLLVVS